MSVAELRANGPTRTDAPLEEPVQGPPRSSMEGPPTRLAYERVLVPTDGSQLSLGALGTARVLATRLGAEVHTVSVASRADDVDELRERAVDAVGSTAGDPRVAVRVGHDPGEAILTRSTELDPCLVCLATRARGRLGRAMFGSVASTIVGRGRPVVAMGPRAVRPSWSPHSRRWPAPLSEPVIAYVDGSPNDGAVLDWATECARTLAVPMTILAVVADAPAPLRGGTRHDGAKPHDDAYAYVEALAARTPDGIEVTGTVRRDPIGVASGIESHVATAPGGLLVVSARLDHELPGGIRPATPAAIVRKSPDPTLIVPVRPSSPGPRRRSTG